MSPLLTPDTTTIARLRATLADWYARRGRQLAFRDGASAWGVLVCEVMAQQTQIARVETAWTAFMARYPTPAALAGAPPSAVLRAWAGMGYNRRALNLQRAAAAIVERHDGQVPADLPALLALPGVGPYTARAVAAIAHGVPVAAVDTNVRRVVGRLVTGHGAAGDPGAPIPAVELQAVADTLVDPANPAGWTHALMDLGATVCRPATPRCDACPWRPMCRWSAEAELRADPHLGLVAVAPRPASRGARAAPRRPEPPFPSTRRWLRGRIVALLRDQPDGAWLELPPAIGEHDATAVREAAAALATDGMLELRPDGAVRLPSGA